MTNHDRLEVYRHKVRFGLKWVALSMVILRCVRFVTGIVLARLLAPSVFGLVAMAVAIIAIIGIFREFGFGQAFIQRRSETDEEERVAANTTFYLLLGINLIFFAAVFPLAPLLADWFNPEKAQELEPVLQVMFCSLLISGFVSTPSLVLQKKLLFGKLSTAEVVASLLNDAIAITLAVSGFGVWSLVYAQITSMIVHSVLLFVLSGWTPRLEFRFAIARELLSFGKYLWAFSALSVIGDAVDPLVLGRAHGMSSVGLYRKGLNLCSQPATQVAFLVNRITFPALAMMRDDKTILHRTFAKALTHVSILAFPMAFGLLAVSEDLILTLYGENWAGAAPIIGVLAFYGMSLAVSSISGPIFKALGKPDVMLYSSLIHHALHFSLLFFLVRFGAVGVAWSILIPMVISSLIAFGLIVRYLDFPVREIVGPIARSGSSALLMFGGVKGFQSLASTLEMARPITLLSSVILGAIVYLASSWLINRAMVVEFCRTAMGVLKARRETPEEALAVAQTNP
jgi:PST family polysaccharide transporter